MKGDKNIRVEFIESKDQRYQTCGNYWETDTEIVFQISKQDKPQKNLLILLHEFVEFAICTDRGISEQSITDFDLQWEKDNPTGIDDGFEPGNSSEAPYYQEHHIAEAFERMFAGFMNIDWEDYNKNLIS